MAVKREKTSVPGVYKRGGGYEASWRDRGRVKFKSGFRTLAAARAFKAERDRGDMPLANGRLRFEDYYAEWIVTYQGRTSRGLKERTRRSYKATMELHVLPFFKGYKLAEVDRRDVRRFITKLEAEGMKDVRRVLAPMKAMFATAAEDNIVSINPTDVRIIGKPRLVEERQERALSHDELAAFLDAVSPKWRFFFEFLTHTGLRISEAIGLTVADVEFGERSRVRVWRELCRGEWDTLKSDGSRRYVPLAPGMAEQLRWGHCVGREPTAPLFATPSGTHLRDENLRKTVLNPARRAVGLDWVGFGYHTFRHTCASLLFANGKNVRQVASWLGHADPAFTLKTYIHLMGDGMGDVSFLDTAMGVNAKSTDHPRLTTDSPSVAILKAA